MADIRSQRAAVLARDMAHARLRRLTVGVLTGAAVTTGVVAGVAASSTHGKTVARVALPAGSATSIPPVPAPVATTPVADAPQPSSAAPVSSTAQPVVVSGGS